MRRCSSDHQVKPRSEQPPGVLRVERQEPGAVGLADDAGGVRQAGRRRCPTQVSAALRWPADAVGRQRLAQRGQRAGEAEIGAHGWSSRAGSAGGSTTDGPRRDGGSASPAAVAARRAASRRRRWRPAADGRLGRWRRRPGAGRATRSMRPGTIGSAVERPWRRVRFRTPRASSADVPSGATSPILTATCATGSDTLSQRSATGRPSIARSSVSGADVQHSDSASSGRWSIGRPSGGPLPAQNGAVTPTHGGPAQVLELTAIGQGLARAPGRSRWSPVPRAPHRARHARAPRRARAARPAPRQSRSARARVPACAGGQASTNHQRPGTRSGYSTAGIGSAR